MAKTETKTETQAQESAASREPASLVSKLTIAKIHGKIKRDAIPEEGVLPLVRVMGQATGIKTGVSTYGEWCAFTGRFVAINIATGEEFTSPVVFLPSVATDLMRPVVAAADGQPVEFAFDLAVRRIPKKAENDNGYEYAVKPLLETNTADPLEALKAKLASKPLPALPQLPKAG